MKSCARKECKEMNPQPMTNFVKHRKGLYPYCKSCKNHLHSLWYKNNTERVYFSNVFRRHGITKARLLEILEEQNFTCKICPKKHSFTEKKKRLHVDHDHKTGKVRGLLCDTCNKKLGVIEQTEFVQIAQEYLKAA